MASLKTIDPTVITKYVQVSKANLRTQFENIQYNFTQLAGVAAGVGSTWYSAAGAPGTGVGIDGDFYLNTANGDVYKKVGGVWVLQMNLTGPAGTGSVSSVNGKTGAVVLAASDVGAQNISSIVTDGSTVNPTKGLTFSDGLQATNSAGTVTLSSKALVAQENGTTSVARVQTLNFKTGATLTPNGSNGVDIDISAAAKAIVRGTGDVTTDRPDYIEFTSPLSFAFAGSTATISLAAVSPQSVGTIIKATALADLGGVGTYVRPGFYRWNGTTWDYVTDLMFDMPRASYLTYTLQQTDFRNWFYFYDTAATPVQQTLNLAPATLLSGDATFGTAPVGYNYEEIYVMLRNKAGLKVQSVGSRFRIPGTTVDGAADSVTIATTDAAIMKVFTVRFTKDGTIYILGQN